MFDPPPGVMHSSSARRPGRYSSGRDGNNAREKNIIYFQVKYRKEEIYIVGVFLSIDGILTFE